MHEQYMSLILLVAVLFQIIAIATPHWSEATMMDVEFSLGLWKGCMGDNCNKDLNDLPPDKLKSVKAVRGLSIVAVVFLSLGFICPFMAHEMSEMCGKWFVLLGALFSFVASGVWYHNLMEMGGNGVPQVKMVAGSSYYMSVMSGMLSLVVSGQLFGMDKMSSY